MRPITSDRVEIHLPETPRHLNSDPRNAYIYIYIEDDESRNINVNVIYIYRLAARSKTNAITSAAAL